VKRLSYLLLFLCWAATGCKKILEKDPLGRIDESQGYLTEDDAKKAVYAAYAPLTLNNWTNLGYMHWVLGNVASDDAEKGGESGSDQLYAQQIALFNIPADNDAIRFAWSSQYTGIRRANLVLDYLPTITMNEALKNRSLAEAKFLRAWYYSNLVKTFGDVPLIISSKTEVFDMERTPKQTVYEQIIKDFTEAEAALPKASEYAAADRGRATKGAAQAYLGKVYLYLKDYPRAEEWFQKVIASPDYTLDPDYLNPFLRAGENSKENIFQTKFFNDQGAAPLNNILSTVMASRSRNGWGFNLPTKDFIDAFEPGDPRLNFTVYKTGDVMPDNLVANVGNSSTGYLTKKYYVPEYERIANSINAGRDDIYMRMGKVKLWYAEAANENGHTTEALDALNDVRERARQGNAGILPDITETGKDALRQLIWKEQRVEFGQEFERFFELVRQGRAGQVLRAYAAKYSTSKGSGFRDGVNEIFPIPQSEINLSKGKLVQNTGY
jgi:tetratricopeptide (TPR) repeat protein